MADIVIIGGGHAAAQIVTSLRQRQFDGTIALVSDEPTIPYQRPPLSKAYLLGDLAAERLPIVRQKIYDSMDVDMRLEVHADAIDRRAKTVTLSDGSSLDYGRLILATGGRARPLNCVGADRANVHYIRTRGDAGRFRDALTTARKLVIVGGGYIGLEVAAAARKLGKDVTLVEAERRLLARVTAPEVSDFYQRVHCTEGVKVLTDQTVAEIRGAEPRTEVITSDGMCLEADLVVAGVGLVPNSEIAAEAGLEVHPAGIIVDDGCRTSDPDIFAVGDVTWHRNRFYDRWMRLESVQNAAEQAKVAVATILGETAMYDVLPWFWSDQYDLKLQMAGLNTGYDALIIRGDINTRSVAFFYLQEGRMIAADCVGRVAEFMQSRKIIASRRPVDAALLSDDSRPFKEIAAEILA